MDKVTLVIVAKAAIVLQMLLPVLQYLKSLEMRLLLVMIKTMIGEMARNSSYLLSSTFYQVVQIMIKNKLPKIVNFQLKVVSITYPS